MQNGRRFVDRVAIITGAGRGIGRGIAEALAAEGCAVAVCARTASQCGETAAAIATAGGRALAAPLDVTNADACRDVVERVVTDLGTPTLLVNAAGISPVYQRLEDHDVDAFRDILDVNVTGTLLMMQAAATQLLTHGGAVLNVASVTAVQAAPRISGYAASKAAVVELTRTAAREWADRGVRVNAIGPGYVETAMTEGLLSSDRHRQRIVDATALGRVGTVSEIAGPALFLLSDDASYVTGAFLLVDGGMAA